MRQVEDMDNFLIHDLVLHIQNTLIPDRILDSSCAPSFLGVQSRMFLNLVDYDSGLQFQLLRRVLSQLLVLVLLDLLRRVHLRTLQHPRHHSHNPIQSSLHLAVDSSMRIHHHPMDLLHGSHEDCSAPFELAEHLSS